MSGVEEFEKLISLLNKKVISKQEFNDGKRDILEGGNKRGFIFKRIFKFLLFSFFGILVAGIMFASISSVVAYKKQNRSLIEENYSYK